MKRRVISLLIAIAAIGELVCGVILLTPWYHKTVSYSQPGIAFPMAILMIAFGGFHFGLLAKRNTPG